MSAGHRAQTAEPGRRREELLEELLANGSRNFRRYRRRAFARRAARRAPPGAGRVALVSSSAGPFRLLRLLPLLRVGVIARRLLSAEGVRDAAVLALLTVLAAAPPSRPSRRTRT